MPESNTIDLLSSGGLTVSFKYYARFADELNENDEVWVNPDIAGIEVVTIALALTNGIMSDKVKKSINLEFKPLKTWENIKDKIVIHRKHIPHY